MNLSEISHEFRKDEIQSPDQKGCPLLIVQTIAGIGAGIGTILTFNWIMVSWITGL